MTTQTKIGILGAAGRMGQMLVREISSGEFPCVLGAGVDQDGNAKAAFQSCDVLIDFTAPAASAVHAAMAADFKKPLVIGTTGFSKAEEAQLAAAAKSAPIFHSANMSVGVNILAAFI